MKQFTKPTNLNGTELVKELLDAGVTVKGKIAVDENNVLWIDIADKDEAKANPIVAAHNGTTIAPKPTVSAKLAALGLTVEDLQALGL
jgi:hypothetical protein